MQQVIIKVELFTDDVEKVFFFIKTCVHVFKLLIVIRTIIKWQLQMIL